MTTQGITGATLRRATRDDEPAVAALLTASSLPLDGVHEALACFVVAEDAGEIVLHDRYHIGIAVATPAGLIVPVVHDADKKDLGQVARDIERLSGEAKSGKIRLEDLRGSCFTVTLPTV